MGWTGQTAHIVRDFNGDGKVDILKIQANGDNHLLFSNGNGTFTDRTPTDLSGKSYTDWYAGTPDILAGDFNGDGNADILIWGSDGTNNLYTSDGFGRFQLSGNPLGSNVPWEWGNTFRVAADFDGDGSADVLMWNSNGSSKMFLSTRGFNNPVDGTMGSWYEAVHITGDFNGDGLMDILVLQSDGNNRLFTSKGDGHFNNIGFLLGIDNLAGWKNLNIKVLPGDFNGDGLMDIIRVDTNSPDGLLFASRGDGTFAVSTVPELGKTEADIYPSYFVGDFNGDGKIDVWKRNFMVDFDFFAVCKYQYTYWSSKVFFAKEGGFYSKGYEEQNLTFPSNGLVCLPENIDKVPILVGDFLGNTKSSFLMWPPSGNAALFVNANAKPVDMLKSFTGAIGGATSIDYTPSTAFNNPLLPFPLWVVKSITANDGIDKCVFRRSRPGFRFEGDRDSGQADRHSVDADRVRDAVVRWGC